MNARRVGGTVLYSVAQQILKYLFQMSFGYGHCGQAVASKKSAGLAQFGLETLSCCLVSHVAVGGAVERADAAFKLHIGHDVLKEIAHSGGTLGDPLDDLPGYVIPIVTGSSLQYFRPGGDGSYGTFQVVRGD